MKRKISEIYDWFCIVDKSNMSATIVSSDDFIVRDKLNNDTLIFKIEKPSKVEPDNKIDSQKWFDDVLKNVVNSYNEQLN